MRQNAYRCGGRGLHWRTVSDKQRIGLMCPAFESHQPHLTPQRERPEVANAEALCIIELPTLGLLTREYKWQIARGANHSLWLPRSTRANSTAHTAALQGDGSCPAAPCLYRLHPPDLGSRARENRRSYTPPTTLRPTGEPPKQEPLS